MEFLGKYSLTTGDAASGARYEEANVDEFTRLDGKLLSDGDIEEIIRERGYNQFPCVRYKADISHDGLTLTVKAIYDKCN